jgi:hypothetical protein
VSGLGAALPAAHPGEPVPAGPPSGTPAANSPKNCDEWETFGSEEKFVGSLKYYNELTIRSRRIYWNKGVATWLAFHDVDEFLFIRIGTQPGNVTDSLDEPPESVGEVQMVMRYRFQRASPARGAIIDREVFESQRGIR